MQDKFRWLCVSLLFSGLCGLFSATGVFGQADKPANEDAFRSEEYIIHQIREGETPTVLAEKFMGDKQKAWLIREANTDRFNNRFLFKAGQFVIIPLKTPNRWGLRQEGYQTVPILSYHQFAENCRSELCMPASAFEGQMEFLKKNGYHTVSFEEFLEYFDYKKPIPEKSVIITIDDGYRSAYDIAYPIMKKYGFRATLFIYTDFVSAAPKAVTWEELGELKAEGFEIGSHTISHCNLIRQGEEETKQDYRSRIKKELAQSKKIIDEKLGQETMALAFPFGNYNAEVLELSRKTGYKAAVTIKGGTNSMLTNPLTLKRNSVFKRDMENFGASLKTFCEFSLKPSHDN